MASSLKGKNFVNISNNIDIIISSLEKKASEYQKPVVTKIGLEGDPFAVLISTVLSLRTKDTTTEKAFLRLWEKASTPKDLLSLSLDDIQKLIYPVGFYKVKANNIHLICKELIQKYNGLVPNDLDKLLELPGIGRKTANLVLTQGFGSLGICVDTHVHRISNRFGYIKTKDPYETEMALREYLPKKYWIIYNDLLVAYGQNLCKPISPFCSKCEISKYCAKAGVKTSR